MIPIPHDPVKSMLLEMLSERDVEVFDLKAILVVHSGRRGTKPTGLVDRSERQYCLQIFTSELRSSFK